MKCQFMSSLKNQENITNLLSAALAQRMEKINLFYFFSLNIFLKRVDIKDKNMSFKSNFFYITTMHTFFFRKYISE